MHGVDVELALFPLDQKLLPSGMLVDLDRRERTVQHRPQVDETSRVVVDLRRATFRFHPNVVDSTSRAGQLERAVVQRVVSSENFCGRIFVSNFANLGF